MSLYLYFLPRCDSFLSMMTSSNGNLFRVTGPLCGEFTGPGEFPAQRPVTRSFDVFFDLCLNKRLSKQPWGWWFETPAWSLWRHRNGLIGHLIVSLKVSSSLPLQAQSVAKISSTWYMLSAIHWAYQTHIGNNMTETLILSFLSNLDGCTESRHFDHFRGSLWLIISFKWQPSCFGDSHWSILHIRWTAVVLINRSTVVVSDSTGKWWNS